MKKIVFFLTIFLFSLGVFAQNNLTVQNGAKGRYLSHIVAPKENFYSIGRLYSTPPKDIASFNALDMSNGLSVGQTVMIPLTATNFSQTSSSGTPVFYTVGDKEGLYRVSVNNNKVLMADLRKWNKLTNDNITTGQRLIVGYLTPSDTAPVAATTPPPVKAESANQPVVQSQTEKPVAVKQEPPAEVKAVRNNPPPVQTVAYTDANGGYFKSQFEQQSRTASAGKDLTVTSGIFKTASGWQDGKYYALMDNVEPGTIVRIANPLNGKMVYAKVLGQMSGIRQNQGLELRISNAASSALEIGDPEKFVVKVGY